MKKEEPCEKKLEETNKNLENAKKEEMEIKENAKERNHESEDLDARVKDYKKKAEDYYDQLLRLKAEFENFRKRVDKEKKELLAWGKYDFMQHLIPLYEMMNMAKIHIENSSSYEDIKTGVNMIFTEFEKLFKNQGVEVIDILNKRYDPMLCEIVQTVEGNDENDGVVVEVVQPGYIMNGKLLKAAKVKVAKKKTESSSVVEKEENSK